MAKSTLVDKLRREHTPVTSGKSLLDAGSVADPIAERLAQDTSGLPKYLRLRPKEARFSNEQLLSLKRIVQHVVDLRADRTAEAITENTLIRVAVDFLVEHWGPRTLGSTEEELLEAFRETVRRRYAEDRS